jgi:methyl-accepting chemotaxis protein
MLNNIKVGKKLMASFLLVAFLTLILGLYMEHSLEDLSEADTELYEKGAKALGELVGAAEKTQEMIIYLRIWQHSKTDEQRAAAIRSMNEAQAEAISYIIRQYGMAESDEVRQTLRNWQSSMEKYGAITYEFTRNAKDFCPTYGFNVNEYPEDLLAVAKEIAETRQAATSLKISAAKALSEKSKEHTSSDTKIAKIAIAAAILLSLLIGAYLTLSITGPLKIVMEDLSKVEQGDLTTRIDMNREDELGVLAKTTDSMSLGLQKIMKDLVADANATANASKELSEISVRLASEAEETLAQSSSVASTTEQMSVNINAMAGGAEQASANANEVAGAADLMSANMNTIAAAIEEMSASISEIANNTADVHHIATEATTKATEATGVMSKLGMAAKEIGQVTDVIKKIADKTNLLALNATIEAASAGESGKGFAVVASEIKELANQSAKSADDIAKRIDGIQSGAIDAVNVISDVSGIIENINHSVETIATHVDQQTKASNEIANNVAQANAGAKRVAGAISEVARGANDVSKNATEAARGAHEVSSSVSNVSLAAKQSSQEVSIANQRINDLARIAQEQKNTVSRFKV